MDLYANMQSMLMSRSTVSCVLLDCHVCPAKSCVYWEFIDNSCMVDSWKALAQWCFPVKQISDTIQCGGNSKECCIQVRGGTRVLL